jgi:hypothetical protein
MHQTSSAQRALLPLIALQGAITTLGGFIGFFAMRAHGVHAVFRYSAGMLTAAVAATWLAYFFGPRLRLDGRRLMRLGFLLPGALMLAGDGSVATMALAFGAFLGLTWGARHWLEMQLLPDGERDGYAARSGTATVVCGVAATLTATLALPWLGHGRDVYLLYGAAAVLGGLLLGRTLPDTPPVSIERPLAVVRQPEFLACLPLFLLESGLYGIGQALGSAGAVEALGSASRFGWVATAAGLIGGVALHLTRRNRDVHNRARWLGGSCLVAGISFVLLGASVWLPALYVAHAVLKAAGAPFLSASEQVLNQRALDIRGKLSDRIVARELVLWALRMTSLLLFWGLAALLSARAMLVCGAALLTLATALEYLIGKSWFWSRNGTTAQAA